MGRRGCSNAYSQQVESLFKAKTKVPVLEEEKEAAQTALPVLH